MILHCGKKKRLSLCFLIFSVSVCLTCCLGNVLAQSSGSAYTPPTTISLIVDGSDERHLVDSMRKLESLKRTKNVIVAEVFVVGAASLVVKPIKIPGLPQYRVSPAEVKRSQQVNEALSFLRNTGLEFSSQIESRRVLDDMGIENSPTWIVRHKGRDYIFEGYSHPTKLFSKKGDFLRAQ